MRQCLQTEEGSHHMLYSAFRGAEQPVDGVDALHRALARVAPGSGLALAVVRRTQRLTVGLTAREPP